MEESLRCYAETAAYFELIMDQVNESSTNEVIKNKGAVTEMVETCWVKLQFLLDNENCSYKKEALIEAQKMLKLTLTDKLKKGSVETNEADSSLKDSNKERSSSIEQTILQETKITFEDIAGLDEAKRLLREAIVLPLQFPHLFVGKRKPWRSILLYGPPGTGKSRMAQAVSSEIESATFYSVSSSNLLSSWFGESEKLIRELFEHARTKSVRAIIFIDEIDSLCRKRDSKEAETTRRVKTELLKQIEGANNKSDCDIFFLCATNCPWELDTAFLRRFEKRIYVSLPNRDARKQLIDIHLGNVERQFNDNDWARLLDQTEGYSGSDIATCVSDATLEPIRDISKTTHWKWSEDKSSLHPSDSSVANAIQIRLQNIPKEKVQPRPVTAVDLLKALSSNHRTISDEDLDRFENWTKSFGHVG